MILNLSDLPPGSPYRDWGSLVEVLAPETQAQNDLGLMYGKGQGVPLDSAETVMWFRKAAEQGDATAQANLAFMYGNGQGVPQDYAEAVMWFRKAAEQGYAIAQGNLGNMYYFGYGVPRDYVQAHMWFNLAASASPAKDRAEAERAGDDVASKLTPAQIAEAERLAREWKPKKGR